MSTNSSLPTRRSVLAASAAAGAVSFLPMHLAAAGNAPPSQQSNHGDLQMDTSNADAIRPFSIHFPDEALADLRRRIAATRWPDKETVTDASQGVQLATMRELARYWETKHDWRKVEARLNALPQFITEIDGLDIHFIHVRSKHENALPMIVTHEHGLAYAQEMSNRPQTLYGIADLPIGLAAWMLDHDIRSYRMIARVFDGQTEACRRDPGHCADIPINSEETHR